ncbi:hypothetical protein EIP91_011811 [Steccherinum ochraceum]|uniref:Uncharacterized protein n=1 Tax=Steccherinum ochraceum TaxID=92696 RepID=A0A4V2MWX7_9APHY|nr:hypothetical protein EIP91_011811 [Steccherinum ochraceum]
MQTTSCPLIFAAKWRMSQASSTLPHLSAVDIMHCEGGDTTLASPVHSRQGVERRGHREDGRVGSKVPYTRVKQVSSGDSKTTEAPAASRESRDQALRKDASDFAKALRSVAEKRLQRRPELDSDLVAFAFCARFSSLKHSSNAPMFWATSLGRNVLEQEGIHDPRDHFKELSKRLYRERLQSSESVSESGSATSSGSFNTGPAALDVEGEAELTLEQLKIKVAEQDDEIQSLKARNTMLIFASAPPPQVLDPGLLAIPMTSSGTSSKPNGADLIMNGGSDLNLYESMDLLWDELQSNPFNSSHLGGEI